MGKQIKTVYLDSELVEQIGTGNNFSQRVEDLIKKGLQAESTTETGKDLLKDLFRVARILNDKARAREIIFKDTKPIEQTEQAEPENK